MIAGSYVGAIRRLSVDELRGAVIALRRSYQEAAADLLLRELNHLTNVGAPADGFNRNSFVTAEWRPDLDGPEADQGAIVMTVSSSCNINHVPPGWKPACPIQGGKNHLGLTRSFIPPRNIALAIEALPAGKAHCQLSEGLAARRSE